MENNPMPNFPLDNNFVSSFKDMLEAAIRAESMNEIKEMIDETIENMSKKIISTNGRRKIVVVYDPEGDINLPNYVDVHFAPDDDREDLLSPVTDAVALLFAAGKRLAQGSPSINEEDLLTDLLCTLEEYIKEVIIGQLIGGVQNGES